MLAADVRTARTTLPIHADEFDKNVVVTAISVVALVHTGFLTAVLPQGFGRAGLSATDLTETGRTLGRGRGSTADGRLPGAYEPFSVPDAPRPVLGSAANFRQPAGIQFNLDTNEAL